MPALCTRRSPAWSNAELVDLISIWGEEAVQTQLCSSHRNYDTYEQISQCMTERGHDRDTLQCRVKVKKLRNTYHKGCYTKASMEPTQITAAVRSIVNTSRIILQYVQNQNLQKQARRRRQRGDESEEDMDTDFSQSMGPGNLDILVAMGQAHAVER
ncbi:hypothetical protein UY3_04745 [Chelonia mydas]|uniref:Myb/SANT-like DNA-binding domain-containing protein n=1 Tax=Chelonia mydas TaxID=8469 RepID=M7CBB9_CHEMY|nr:hypothetical protein UY3_04745 [Chelonia mydas]